MLSTNSNNKGNGCCTVVEVLEPRDYLAWYGIKSNSLLNKPWPKVVKSTEKENSWHRGIASIGPRITGSLTTLHEP